MRRIVWILAALAWMSQLVLAQEKPRIPPGSKVHLTTSARARIEEDYGRLPLAFEANHGQTAPQARFISRGRGCTLFLAPDETVVVLGLPAAVNRAPLVLRMRWLGASPGARMAGVEELAGKTGYFIGSDPAKWRTHVRSFRKVLQAGLYPGVDLVFYGNQRQLESDLIVAPGADPAQIRLAPRPPTLLCLLPRPLVRIQNGILSER